MLLYLFDRFELSGTCDEAGAAEAASRRGRAATWVVFANSTMGNAIYLEHMRDAEMPNVMGAPLSFSPRECVFNAALTHGLSVQTGWSACFRSTRSWSRRASPSLTWRWAGS